MSVKDLTGKKFGNLTVISFNSKNNKRYKWNCKCDCGNNTITDRSDLISGKSTSCGCRRLINTKKSNTKHGQSKTRIYKIWLNMKKRCIDEKSINYEYYGGKGITLCERWMDYENFYNDMKLNYEDSLTLDRIDNSKGYNVENCRWVSMSVQQFNKSISSRNKSGHVGVYFDKKSGKWRATIGFNKEQINLGMFDDLDCAVKARKEAEVNYYDNC